MHAFRMLKLIKLNELGLIKDYNVHSVKVIACKC